MVSTSAAVSSLNAGKIRVDAVHLRASVGRVKTVILLLSSLVVASCGGRGSDQLGMAPLLEDPAMETACITVLPSLGQTRAKRVVCSDELLSGRMAAGRTGDYLLENSKIRVIIRGPGHGLYLYGTTGGAMIDAAQHGRDDLLQEIVPLVEFNTGIFDEIVVVEAGDDGPAELVVRGAAVPTPLFAWALGTEAAQVIIEQRYRLAPDDIAVAVETRVYAEPDSTTDVTEFGLIDVLFFGGRIDHRIAGADDDSNRGPFLASSGTSTSYGIVFDRNTTPVVSLLEIVFFKLLLHPAITVDVETLTRYFVIGDGSFSSVVDRAWQLYGEETATVSGSSSPLVEIVARTESGSVASIARTGEDGSFAFDLPLGTYTLSAEAANRLPGPPMQLSLVAAASDISLQAGATGVITLTATVDSAMVVARVAISGVGESAGIERLEYTAPDGTLSVGLPPGSYRVTVSKGMEYDAFSAEDVVVAANGQVALQAALTRVLATDGWISVDPHMHSEMSIDSNVPLDERLLSIAGEGVEIAISSDHDFIVDYAPVATELGLGAELATQSGQESSSLILGHVNAWPSPVDPDKPGGGAIAWYGAGPKTLFELARAGDPSRIVQVNHPWDPLGLFTAIGFDRETLKATKSGADLDIPGADLNNFDFDALEVGNKKTPGSFEPSFLDWLALVSGGFKITATGASDSHGDDAYVGEARTYVYVGTGLDDPAIIDLAAVNTAIRNQRVVVAQGVFVTAGVVLTGGSASIPGEVVDLSAATEAVLRIRVQAPPWLPVGALVIYERDEEIMRIALNEADTQAIRYQEDLVLPLDTRDTLFVVAVEAAGDGRPVMEDKPQPSFTNPVYVDRDGNGAFDP